MLHLLADVSFRVQLSDEGAGPATTGRVSADGTDVVVSFSRAPSFAGFSTRPLVRPLAQQLARAGLTVYLRDPAGPLLRLGAGVQAPWWQRFATGSRLVQVHSPGALRRTLGGPRLFEAALPTAAALPGGSRSIGLVRRLGRRLTGRRR